MIPVEMANDAIPGRDAGLGTEWDAIPVVVLSFVPGVSGREGPPTREGTGQGRALGGAAGEAVTSPLPVGKESPQRFR